jgi:hypothetical protein
MVWGLQRIYSEIDVSSLTIKEIQKIIAAQDIEYSGDFGLKNDQKTRLIFSLN